MPAGGIEAQLGDDEAVEGGVDVGTNRVVVTGRRVLSFTPEAPGTNYRAVDRPNVDDVTVGTRSDRGYLTWGAIVAVTALVLLAGWVLFDAGGLFPAATGRGASALGVGGMIGQMRSWLGLLDAAMLWGGVLLLLVGAALVGLYVRSRETVVSIVVAGDRNLTVPGDGVADPKAAADDLRSLLGFPPRYERPDRRRAE